MKPVTRNLKTWNSDVKVDTFEKSNPITGALLVYAGALILWIIFLIFFK